MKRLVYGAMRRLDRWTVKAYSPMPKPLGLGPTGTLRASTHSARRRARPLRRPGAASGGLSPSWPR